MWCWPRRGGAVAATNAAPAAVAAERDALWHVITGPNPQTDHGVAEGRGDKRIERFGPITAVSCILPRLACRP
jgi:hypothetical protein